MIRKANETDVKRIIELLHQVNMVHYEIRPDLFKPHTTKYDEHELEALLTDDQKPVFVYEDGQILGYAFCQITEVKGHALLQDVKTLYIDDICVDEAARGRHVGKALYEHVHHYAQVYWLPQYHPERMGREHPRPELLQKHGHGHTEDDDGSHPVTG